MKPSYSIHGVLDPVAAYDRVAPVFNDLSRRREAYLRKIEELVAARVSANSQSLLDVGAGDGRRALRIARAAEINKVVLLEPSANMREGADAFCEIWPIRAEMLADAAPAGRTFDAIICLWNVLGHIRPQERLNVLKAMGRLLSRNGVLFVDVNHRYNMQAYGLWRTAGRILYDRIFPSVNNGDVTMSWNVRGERCNTYGHVFTQIEMQRLVSGAELVTRETIFVDYESGEIRESGLKGNLFYVLGQG